MLMVSSPETWCGGASSSRAPSSIPVGYASQTGYQYDSISRVAGQRDPAPPSKFSKEGGFKNSVFKGISWILYLNIRSSKPRLRLYHLHHLRSHFWRPSTHSSQP